MRETDAEDAGGPMEIGGARGQHFGDARQHMRPTKCSGGDEGRFEPAGDPVFPPFEWVVVCFPGFWEQAVFHFPRLAARDEG